VLGAAVLIWGCWQAEGLERQLAASVHECEALRRTRAKDSAQELPWPQRGGHGAWAAKGRAQLGLDGGEARAAALDGGGCE
jgi:hypothetical protein